MTACLSASVCASAVIVLFSPHSATHEEIAIAHWDKHSTGTRKQILKAGTNAIPGYLKMLNASNGRLKRTIVAGLNKLPAVDIQTPSADLRQCAAINALQTLGRDAHQTYPTLIQMLQTPGCPDLLPRALFAIHPEDSKMIEDCLTHTNWLLQYVAAIELREHVKAGRPPPVELLIETLSDNANPRIVLNYIEILSYAPKTNASARRELEKHTTNPNMELQSLAVSALERFNGSTSSVHAPKSEDE